MYLPTTTISPRLVVFPFGSDPSTHTIALPVSSTPVPDGNIITSEPERTHSNNGVGSRLIFFSIFIIILIAAFSLAIITTKKKAIRQIPSLPASPISFGGNAYSGNGEVPLRPMSKHGRSRRPYVPLASRPVMFAEGPMTPPPVYKKEGW